MLKEGKHAFDVCLLLLAPICFSFSGQMVFTVSAADNQHHSGFDWLHLHGHEHILKRLLLLVSVFMD